MALAVSSIICLTGVPEDVEAARLYLAQLDCLEVIVPIERKAFSAIYGPGGANLRQMEVGNRHAFVLPCEAGGPSLPLTLSLQVLSAKKIPLFVRKPPRYFHQYCVKEVQSILKGFVLLLYAGTMTPPLCPTAVFR